LIDPVASLGRYKITPGGVKYFVSVCPISIVITKYRFEQIHFYFLIFEDMAESSRILLQHRNVPRGFFNHGRLQRLEHRRRCFLDFFGLLVKLNSISGCPYYAMIDETYSHGNGSESWCRSNSLIPEQLMQFQTNPVPRCDHETCWLAKFFNVTTDPYLSSQYGYYKENVTIPAQFICSVP